MRGTKVYGLCGPDCAYKGLYAGSQASLSDMSAQQAVALGRVSRLLVGFVYAM